MDSKKIFIIASSVAVGLVLLVFIILYASERANRSKLANCKQSNKAYKSDLSQCNNSLNDCNSDLTRCDEELIAVTTPEYAKTRAATLAVTESLNDSIEKDTKGTVNSKYPPPPTESKTPEVSKNLWNTERFTYV